MLHLEVGSYVSHSQLFSTLPTHYHSVMIHKVRVSLAGHLTPIGCGICFPGNGPRLTHYLQHLCQIIYNPKLIKEANYYFKSPLQLHLIGEVN